MRVRWTPEAAQDLEMIADYLWLHRPEFASTTISRIYEQAKALSRFPHIGHPSRRRADCRELVLSPLPYILTYSVDEHAIRLLQIRHGAQDDVPIQ